MADVLGSLVNGIFGMGGTALSYNEQKKLIAQQNQYNIDMWKMNNEYNSPQAQMQRFKDAGLNPNLIYGQGTAGNSSVPPQQVTAQAPDWSKNMQKLAEAFNIEGLLTTRANRMKAQQEANIAKWHALNLRDEREAWFRIGDLYHYDPQTGRFVWTPNNVHVGDYSKGMGENSTLNGLFTRIMADNARNTYLLPYRSALLEHQKNYLAPQISMANYEAKYYPYSYWIGQGGRVIHAASDVVGMVNPLRKAFKPLNYSYRSPYGANY